MTDTLPELHTAGLTVDPDEIRRALALFQLDGPHVLELRAPESHRGVASGYYDDAEALLRDAAYLSGKATSVYVTPNPCQPDLLARAANRCRDYVKSGGTTKDADIQERRWLLLDFDAVRPSGISSSDAEHDAAIERAEQCGRYLLSLGWPAPILADSGNGAHLLCRVDLPNDPESTLLHQRVLEALSVRFDDERVKVDPTTHNAARIWKLYGTLVCKGDQIPGRPHRLARIIRAPQGTPRIVEGALLDALAALAPARERNARTREKGSRIAGIPSASSRGDYATLDIVRWFSAHGAYGRPVSAGKHAVLCPWSHEHSDRSEDAAHTDTTVWEADGGDAWPQFHCLHAHCAGRTIEDVVGLWGDADRYCDLTLDMPTAWPSGTDGIEIKPARDQSLAPRAADPCRVHPCSVRALRDGVDADHRPAMLYTLAKLSRRQGMSERMALAMLTLWDAHQVRPMGAGPEMTAAEVAGAYLGGEGVGCGNLQAVGLCPAADAANPEPCPLYGVDADAQAHVAAQLRAAPDFSIEPIRKVGTAPPRWMVTVRGEEIEVPHDVLMDWRRFKLNLAAILHFIPQLPALYDDDRKRIPAQSVWEQQFLNPALAALEGVEVAPADASARGAMWDNVAQFLRESRKSEDLTDAYDGKIALFDETYFFKGSLLRSWLSRNNIRLPAEDELWMVVRDHGGVSKNKKRKGKQAWLWQVPKSAVDGDGDVSGGDADV